METLTYQRRRGQLETYFDRTAVEAWAKLTSDAPVSRIRATVRAGRDDIRKTLLDWLPADLSGCSLLDAGCGTGALSIEAAKRGATVTAVDLSSNLIRLARERLPRDIGGGSIDFIVGDMLDPYLGAFDYVVAMDSLIHYRRSDLTGVVSQLAARTSGAVIFTFAPRTPLLTAMHAMGRLFPRSERAPAIQPIGAEVIQRDLRAMPGLRDWRIGRTHRVDSGFYISQALEVVRA
jgi:magnesium-protoporphyrin O-methyltransferase